MHPLTVGNICWIASSFLSSFSLHHIVGPFLHSCIHDECHTHPTLILVQRLQYGVTLDRPSHCTRTCLLHERAFLQCKPWQTQWLKLGMRGQRWGVNVYWKPSSLPSINQDNQASAFKLSSVCITELREHYLRDDLCPNLHMFSIHSLFFTMKIITGVDRKQILKDSRGPMTLLLDIRENSNVTLESSVVGW